MSRSTLLNQVRKGERAASELYREDVARDAWEVIDQPVQAKAVRAKAESAVDGLEQALNILQEGLCTETVLTASEKQAIIRAAKKVYAGDLEGAVGEIR